MRQLDHAMSVHAGFEPVASRYAALGFHLTDITHHPTGTGNRLMVFQSNFFELLATTRPELIDDQRRAMVDGYLRHRSGLSGIAVRSESQRDDLAAFAAGGAPNVVPRAFQRPVTLPDDADGMADVEIVMTRDPDTPLVFFFASHQKRPEAVWQPAWQDHPNGAIDMVEVACVEAPGQDSLVRYRDAVLGADASGRVAHGYAVTVSPPDALQSRYQWAGLKAEPHAAYVAGLAIQCENLDYLRKAIAAHDIPATCRDTEIFVSPDWTDGVFLHFVAA